LVVITSIYILSKVGLDMAEREKSDKMNCPNGSCRVVTFERGGWKDGLWEYEDSSAWSAMQNNRCPGCGEVGEDL